MSGLGPSLNEEEIILELCIVLSRVIASRGLP